jgi:L-iditol 2-dehydrogenase
MKAAFLRAPFEVEFREIAAPEVGPGQLLLRPLIVGICGSDIQYAKRLATDWLRFGHEPVCEVTAVGLGVIDLVPGDIVACQTSSACGFCASCMLGRVSDCENRYSSMQDGYFAEAVVVDRRNVWKISGISLEAAILLEPMGMAFDALRLAEMDLRTTLAVVGPGPIGLMTIRIAKIRGVQRILAIGVAADQDREDLCMELGAEDFINADLVDPIDAVLDLTAGRGVDSVVNTATLSSVPSSLAMCAYGGRVVFMGETTMERQHARPLIGADTAGTVPIDVNWIHVNRLDLRGSFAVPNGLLPAGNSLLRARAFPVDKMVTHIFPMSELESALRLVANREDGVVKAAIRLTDL